MADLYASLDALILEQIEKDVIDIMNDQKVCDHADLLAKQTKREAFRIIDSRLTALKRAEKIKFLRKKESPWGQPGWFLTQKT